MPTDNGVTYGENKIPVCWDCWCDHCEGKINLKSLDAFVGGPAIFTRKQPATRRHNAAGSTAVLF